MAPSEDDEERAYLDGDKAVEWFMTTRGGPNLFDAHIIAINSVFGHEVRMRTRAATDPRDSSPKTLILEVDASDMQDEDVWEKTVRVQEELLGEGERISSLLSLDDPLRDIVVVVVPTEEEWNQTRREFGEI
ncbi:hypothetical protein [Lentzea sp. NPDC060358]|uniref:hypothetical protein n=1 Tax=Lentzea sp. NPDC060358 TaxID=3347103 RepID=UPI003666B6FC